jgi:hypothetical protein
LYANGDYADDTNGVNDSYFYDFWFYEVLTDEPETDFDGELEFFAADDATGVDDTATDDFWFYDSLTDKSETDFDGEL